ncbi:S9 family peptidase [Egibacter rhizosphaerae]|uniref:prolyl oligopeptidase n=1 Tax=Egibacter rhizosphaerae TaxID=1670831 RepID=A0A411YBS1_9ACTN|nr:prolyl oligopeptidase family serine peptidase [Egibacter rhizosphaerae]QBI18636.1 S9 family peptidase [Egibacter rhizosphaerae]
MISYPDTRADDHVEDHHGRKVPDPYHWLEDTTDPRVHAWIDAQNAVTEEWLADAEEREAFRARLRELTDRPRAGAPWCRGERWFQLRNAGLDDQPTLWVADAPDATGAVLLEPTAEGDETTALTGAAVTRDGALLAYALSGEGSDWQTWRVRDVASGRDHDDVVEWSKFSPAAWLPDGSGFFYGAFDPPAADGAYLAATRGQWLALHRLGTPQADDEVVFVPEDPDWVLSPMVSDDGRWLVVTLSRGTDPHSRVWVADLAAGESEPRPLLDAADASYEPLDVVGGELYVQTDAGAPRERIVAIDLARSRVADDDASRWREVVAEDPTDTLDHAVIAGDRVLTLWLADASSRLRRDRLDGEPDGEVALPGLGTVESLAGRPGDPLVHLTFASFTRPSSIWRHHLETGETTEVGVPRAGPLPFDPERFVTDRLVAESADGTRVPFFLVRRRDLEPAPDGGPHPTLLWGYGGFRIPVTPMFRTHWLAWVERGGVLAVPNLRGGGEFGAAWHADGRLERKQHVFDDAIGVAQQLVEQGWTHPERIAIKGRSNGGLLAGACLTQRPDLFGAAVVEVGVLDMLRFHHSTIGWAWKSDYGDPEDPADVDTLLAYSPLHNVADGTAYPATLVTTGDHDDRVVPGHSFKFAATLQAAQSDPSSPVLLRVDRSGGHGAGKPTAMAIDERADVLAFLARTLGLPADSER